MQVDCSDLVARLDRAVEAGSVDAVTSAVKRELEALLGAGALSLPDTFRHPRADTYARRLWHRDPAGRYTAVVMTWGPGQGTPVHDHGGLWCVEGVVEGRIAVTPFDVTRDPDGFYRVTPGPTELAGVGAAGRLIPPTDYHVLTNARPDAPSVTLHVYGGDLCACTVFLPQPDGRCAAHTRTLAFHD